MKRAAVVCLLVATSLGAALAQAPVGIISGKVADESGAVIPGASIVIKNKTTGAERQLVSAVDGAFSIPGLPAGLYDVRVEAKGFRTIVREATVETGATTTADIRMLVGEVTEVVSVQAATSQIEYERHAIDGVITRQKIQELPLNGRSFLQLAFLEPGVTVSRRALQRSTTRYLRFRTRRRIQQDGDNGGRRQCAQRDRRPDSDQLLPGNGAGVSALLGQFRSLDRHHERRARSTSSPGRAAMIFMGAATSSSAITICPPIPTWSAAR